MARVFDEGDISSLISAIYAASSDPTRWQEFIRQLHALFPRGPTILYGHDATVNRYLGMVHHGFTDEDSSRFVQHYAAVSPFTKPIASSPLRQARRVLELCAPEKIKTTEYFNDFMLPRRGGGGAAIVLYRQQSRSLFLTCECDVRLSDEIEPHIVNAMAMLSGHIMQSFDIMRRLSGQRLDRANIDHMVNLIGDAAYVIDARRRILTMNARAEALLAGESGWRSVRGELLFNDAATQQFLLKSLSDVETAQLDAFRSTHFMQGPGGRYLVTVCPLARDSERGENLIYDVVADSHPFAVVVVTHIDPRSADSAALARRLFGLTQAEAKLAAALAGGTELQTYADANRLSIHTVRNQLKSVFSKTDTSRQIELALMLNRISAAAFGEGGVN